MKKIFCTLLVLIASVVSVYADDALTAQNITIPKGGTELLQIDLTNAKPYGAFQFDLVLPSGISATNVLKTSRITSVEGKETFTAKVNLTDAANNVYTIAVYNDNRMEFAGTSGAIIIVSLSDDGSREIGTSGLEGVIKNIALSDIDAHQTNVADFSFTIEIGENDGRLKFFETSEVLPEFTSGQKYSYTVYRTLKENEWSTICFPFGIPGSQMNIFGEGYQLALFKGYEAQKEGNEITGLTLIFETASSIEANKPYVIRTKTTITELKVNNRTITSGVSPITNISVWDDEEEEFFDVASLNGTYKANTVIPKNSLFLSGNKFYYSTGKTKMKAFRAYFTLNDVLTEVSSAASRITMSFEDPTGINEVKAVEDDRYYNLSGQQVKPEKKGLYIQNGKKKIIK